MLVIHGGAAYYAWSFYQAGSRIFVGSVNPDQSMEPSPTEDWDYGFGQQPFETPSAPVTGKPRLTILLTGIDKNTDRTHSLTDTLLVVSIDPNTHTVAMVSTPRDVSEFLLPDGRQYNGKINSLMSWANARPELYPEGGLAVLARTISNLLGVPINYYAAIDLDGFERIINEAGGVDVTVSRAITDGRYDWLDGSERGFYLSKGDHHLDGRTALAYVRSRQGTGDSDFTRAARQQQLLLALRAKLTDPSMFTKLPSLLDAAADMIRTNFPNDQLSTMLDLARVIGDDSFTRIVLQPPTYSYHPPTNTTNGTYILRLKMDAVAQLSEDLFGTDSRYFGTVAATPTGSPAP
jgi:LCP family protein required for cell wall assembly